MGLLQIFKSLNNNERKDNPERQQKEQALDYTTSMMYGLQGGFISYNPDSLVQRKGAAIYKSMLRDDQVKSAFQLKTNIVLSRQMTFDVISDDQIEAAEFCERNITDLITGTWKKALRSILMGKAWGFSITEKIFRTDEVDNKPRWVIDRLKSKPWTSFEFEVDKYGNEIGLYQDTGDKRIKLDKNRFIKYVNMPEIDSIWGESDLKAAYRPYWEKDIIQKFWNIYIERAAGGFIAATPNERATNLSPIDRAEFEKVLSNISGTSGIRVPNGYDVKLEIPRDVTAFERAIDKKDKQISRALLLPNFLGFSEQGAYGSYAQSQTVLDMFMMLIEEECDYLADLLNEHLFNQLCWWNFGLKNYPRAKFGSFTTEQKHAIARVWMEAVKSGVVTNTFEDEIYTRQLLFYPKRKEENDENIDEQNENIDEQNENTDEQDTDKQNNKNNSAFSNIQKNKGNFEEKKTEIDFEKPLFSDRIEFKQVEKRLDAIEKDFYSELAKGVDTLIKEAQKGIKEAYKTIKDKEIDAEEMHKKISATITTKTKSKLNKTAYNQLKITYDYGRKIARLAIEKSLNKAPKEIKKKIKLNMAGSIARACLADNWTITYFIDGISLDVAESWFSSNAFTIAGGLTDTVINSAVQVLINGIRDELSVDQIINNLEGVLPTLVGTTERAERARLETIVRTNMSTIFTQAQLAYYTDPALNGFVEGLEYSAVLDRRTTPVCLRLDGAKYAITNSIWESITPPNHHNCRSVLIPITILDDWRSSRKKYTERQLPARGFGRETFPDQYML